MAITQLGLYNEALRMLGERQLLNLSENREPLRVLNAIWDNNAIQYCLEQGLWNFATRAVEITPSATLPAFGYANAFDKPSDLIRTVGVAEDEFFNVPLLQIQEEVGFWYADIDPIYVRYISSDGNYGADYTRWPQTFAKYVASYLASEAAWTLTQNDKKKADAINTMLFRLRDARSKDAMEDATAFPPQGGWTSSRHSNSQRDRGRRNNLIG